jgi:hypothetical protein
MKLIARDDLEYYETNFDPPTTDWNKVYKLWEIVPKNQKDVTWQHEILMMDGNAVVVHAKITRTLLPSKIKQKIDVAFLFKFDDEDKINYFQQWRSVEEEK